MNLSEIFVRRPVMTVLVMAGILIFGVVAFRLLPVSQLPGFVQKIAPYLPSYHYGQLAWSAVGARAEPLAVSLAWLAGYTVVFLAIAMRTYRREETRKFA